MQEARLTNPLATTPQVIPLPQNGQMTEPLPFQTEFITTQTQMNATVLHIMKPFADLAGNAGIFQPPKLTDPIQQTQVETAVTQGHNCSICPLAAGACGLVNAFQENTLNLGENLLQTRIKAFQMVKDLPNFNELNQAEREEATRQFMTEIKGRSAESGAPTEPLSTVTPQVSPEPNQPLVELQAETPQRPQQPSRIATVQISPDEPIKPKPTAKSTALYNRPRKQETHTVLPVVTDEKAARSAARPSEAVQPQREQSPADTDKHEDKQNEPQGSRSAVTQLTLEVAYPDPNISAFLSAKPNEDKAPQTLPEQPAIISHSKVEVVAVAPVDGDIAPALPIHTNLDNNIEHTAPIPPVNVPTSTLAHEPHIVLPTTAENAVPVENTVGPDVPPRDNEGPTINIVSHETAVRETPRRPAEIEVLVPDVEPNPRLKDALPSIPQPRNVPTAELVTDSLDQETRDSTSLRVDTHDAQENLDKKKETLRTTATVDEVTTIFQTDEAHNDSAHKDRLEDLADNQVESQGNFNPIPTDQEKNKLKSTPSADKTKVEDRKQENVGLMATQLDATLFKHEVRKVGEPTTVVTNTVAHESLNRPDIVTVKKGKKIRNSAATGEPSNPRQHMKNRNPSVEPMQVRQSRLDKLRQGPASSRKVDRRIPKQRMITTSEEASSTRRRKKNKRIKTNQSPTKFETQCIQNKNLKVEKNNSPSKKKGRVHRLKRVTQESTTKRIFRKSRTPQIHNHNSERNILIPESSHINPENTFSLRPVVDRPSKRSTRRLSLDQSPHRSNRQVSRRRISRFNLSLQPHIVDKNRPLIKTVSPARLHPVLIDRENSKTTISRKTNIQTRRRRIIERKARLGEMLKSNKKILKETRVHSIKPQEAKAGKNQVDSIGNTIFRYDWLKPGKRNPYQSRIEPTHTSDIVQTLDKSKRKGIDFHSSQRKNVKKPYKKTKKLVKHRAQILTSSHHEMKPFVIYERSSEKNIQELKEELSRLRAILKLIKSLKGFVLKPYEKDNIEKKPHGIAQEEVQVRIQSYKMNQSMRVFLPAIFYFITN